MEEKPAKLDYAPPPPSPPMIENGADVMNFIIVSLILGGCAALAAVCAWGLLH